MKFYNAVVALIIAICFCGLYAKSLSQVNQPSRRSFLHYLPASVATVNLLLPALDGCSCPKCFGVRAAIAYERRDVGGSSPSPETAAMNIQAFETMNRLERDGVKLETAAEQSASLTAALSEYAYKPSSSGKKEVDKYKPKHRKTSDS